MNSELCIISSWFKANKLSLNIDKTNFLVFHPYQKSVPDIKLFIDNIKLVLVHVTKFLGVLIDENLSWKPHIHKISCLISRNIGILYKLKHIFPRHILLSLYNSLILPHLNYCSIVWASTYPTYVNQLFILQKRAIRFIANKNFRDHTFSLFHDLGILSVFDIYKYQLGIFMYRLNNNLIPSNLKKIFTKTKDIHSYNTRSKDNFYHDFSSSSIHHRSIRFSAPRFWNSLPVNIKSKCSISSFKKALKNLLLEDPNTY